MRLRKRRLLSKQMKRGRLVYGLVSMGMFVLLFCYSIAFCAVSTDLNFKGTGKVEGGIGVAGPYYYYNGYFYYDKAQASVENDSYRIKYKGSYVSKLSEMVNVMDKDSSGNYVIYIMGPYEVTSEGETVKVGKDVNIYLDEYNNKDIVFTLKGDLTIETVDSGSLNITVYDKDTSFTLSRYLFDEYSRDITLTLNGKIKISDFTISSALIYVSNVNLIGTEIVGMNGYTILHDMNFFVLDSVNIHDNIAKIGAVVVSGFCSKITGSSKIYDNRDTYNSKKNLKIDTIPVDGTGLTSDCKIMVTLLTSFSSGDVYTIIKNIDRNNVIIDENVFYESDDQGLFLVYKSDDSITNICITYQPYL